MLVTGARRLAVLHTLARGDGIVHAVTTSASQGRSGRPSTYDAPLPFDLDGAEQAQDLFAERDNWARQDNHSTSAVIIILPHDCSDELFGPCSCGSGSPDVDLDGEDDDDLDDDEEPDPYADVEEEGDLGDLYPLGLQLFNIWCGGTEVEWAEYMWTILERAGLTAYEEGDEVERTLVVCRLVALAGINLEFAARAWDEGYPGEWRESVHVDILGDYPLLDPVSVGRLAERTGVWTDSVDDGRESVTGLIHEIAAGEWDTVVRALLKELGDSYLFASLWATRDGDARYPLPAEVVGEITSTDMFEKADAYGWVSDGCSPHS